MYVHSPVVNPYPKCINKTKSPNAILRPLYDMLRPPIISLHVVFALDDGLQGHRNWGWGAEPPQ